MFLDEVSLEDFAVSGGPAPVAEVAPELPRGPAAVGGTHVGLPLLAACANERAVQAGVRPPEKRGDKTSVS